MQCAFLCFWVLSMLCSKIGDKWQKTIVVNCRYLKSGPGKLDRDIERKFSYALSREDVENAILGGPWFQSTPVIQPTFPLGCGFFDRGRHHTQIGTWVEPEVSFWFWLVVCVLILWMIVIPKRGFCDCKCNASQGRYHLWTKQAWGSHISDGAVEKYGVLNDTRHGRVE